MNPKKRFQHGCRHQSPDRFPVEALIPECGENLEAMYAMEGYAPEIEV